VQVPFDCLRISDQLLQQYTVELCNWIVAFGNQFMVSGHAERICRVDTDNCGVETKSTILSDPTLLKSKLSLTKLIVAINSVGLLKEL
jgi:hypothetical protein